MSSNSLCLRSDNFPKFSLTQHSPLSFFIICFPGERPKKPVPLQDQTVRDEKGRYKRFHGAFSGGFSAGYFNTVGSKEGTVLQKPEDRSSMIARAQGSHSEVWFVSLRLPPAFWGDRHGLPCPDPILALQNKVV